jgi:hypothetical protein
LFIILLSYFACLITAIYLPEDWQVSVGVSYTSTLISPVSTLPTHEYLALNFSSDSFSGTPSLYLLRDGIILEKTALYTGDKFGFANQGSYNIWVMCVPKSHAIAYLPVIRYDGSQSQARLANVFSVNQTCNYTGKITTVCV